MDWLVVCCHTCFFECLWKSWVGVACASDVFSWCSVFEGKYTFMDQFSCRSSNDVASENFVCFCISKNLNQALGILVSSCSAVGLEWEHSFPVFNSCSFEFFFCLTNTCDFWVCVDNWWNCIVVYVTTFTDDVFNGSNAFFFRFVSKHWASNYVTDCVDVGLRCLPCLVDVNQTSISGFETSFLKLESSSKSVTTDWNQSNVNFNRACSSISSVSQVDCNTILLPVDSIFDLSIQHEFHALLLKDVLEGFTNFNVQEWADPISVLDNSNFSSESLVNTSHFDSDDTSSNNTHSLWNFCQGEGTCWRDNKLFISSKTTWCGQCIRLWSCSNDAILKFDLISTSTNEVNIDSVLVGELPPALDVVDFVLLE